MKNKIVYILLAIGISLILLKSFLPEHIDQEGFLQEKFFLLPIGFSVIVLAIICFIINKIRK